MLLEVPRHAPCFEHHFPRLPCWPGALVLFALARAVAPDRTLAFAERARVRRLFRPGDRVEVALVGDRIEATIEGEPAASATVSFREGASQAPPDKPWRLVEGARMDGTTATATARTTSPALAFGAIGDLATWLEIVRSDFEKSLLLGAFARATFHETPPDELLRVEVELERSHENAGRLNGRVLAGTRPIVTLERATCAFVPLEEHHDRARVRELVPA